MLRYTVTTDSERRDWKLAATVDAGRLFNLRYTDMPNTIFDIFAHDCAETNERWLERCREVRKIVEHMRSNESYTAIAPAGFKVTITAKEG